MLKLIENVIASTIIFTLNLFNDHIILALKKTNYYYGVIHGLD